MTKEEIVKLAVDNDLVEEVYNTLHYIIMAKLANLMNRAYDAESELQLIKKYANANKLNAIKDILAESDEDREKKWAAERCRENQQQQRCTRQCSGCALNYF